MGNHYWPLLPQTTNRPDSTIWAISTSALSGTDMQIEKPLICRLQAELGYVSFSFYIQYLPTIFLNNSLSFCKRLTIKFTPHKCPWRIQLLRERLSAKMCTRRSRKVMRDMINTLFQTVAVKIFFCCFPLARANTRPWPLVPFFQISLKNSELKTTYNTCRDCRVHFFRQPFSK